MHISSNTADGLIVFALACIVLMVPLRQSSHAIFNGGILLALGLSIACALPILSHLPWTELADEASDQAIAALHFLEVAYTILTL